MECHRAGQSVTEDQIAPLHAEFVANTRKKGKTKKRSAKPDSVDQ